jgi:hypothetical protein
MLRKYSWLRIFPPQIIDKITEESPPHKLNIIEKDDDLHGGDTDTTETASLSDITTSNRSRLTIGENMITNIDGENDFTPIELVNHKQEKTVSFCNIVRVCLIPTRVEFMPMFSDLWWSINEIEDFKHDAYHEMKTFLEKNNCSLKQGMIALYQPCYTQSSIPTVLSESQIDYENNNITIKG